MMEETRVIKMYEERIRLAAQHPVFSAEHERYKYGAHILSLVLDYQYGKVDEDIELAIALMEPETPM